MIGVLKSGGSLAAGRVRSLETPAAIPSPTRAETELQAMNARLAEQAACIKARDEQIAALSGDIARARLESEAAGHAAGFAEGGERREEAIELLENGIADAVARYADALASLERLAVVLASNCLDIVFGDADPHGERLCALIRHQIAGLEAEAVVRIDVSQADFADADCLAALSARIGPPAIDIRASAALEPGECHILLTLGSLSVGIDQQWGRLRSTLTALAEPADAS